ncbi:MAG TPA: hypothetical protein VF787_14490 [Thermoanaerobaculia bacterium]
MTGAAPAARWEPSISSNGNEFFAVWTDSRVAFNRVIGTRLNDAGEVLDGPGIAISAGTQFHPAFEPRVVWSGSFWLVFWQSRVENGSVPAIIAARVDRDGKLVGAPYMLAKGFPGQGQYVATNGSLTVLGFTELGGAQPRALVLDREGNLIRNVALPTAWVSGGQFAVATNGSDFLVAWEAYNEPNTSVEMIRIDATGNVRDTVATSVAGSLPFLASDGTDYVLLAQRLNVARLFWTTRKISADLTASESTYLPEGDLFGYPTLMFRGDRYVMVGQHGSNTELRLDVAAVTIGRNGVPDPTVTSLADLRIDSVDPQVSTALTAAGKLAVVWIETASSGGFTIHTRARLFDSLDRAASSPSLLLSRSADPHYGQALAYGNGLFFAAWRSTDGIYASRVTADGRTLDGRGIRISDLRWSDPSVAFDGTNFVVGYLLDDELHLRYVAPNGNLLDEVILAVTDHDNSPPALAVSPDDLYVVWSGYQVMITRIPHATHVASMPVPVSPEMMPAQPRIAWNGSQLLVAWADMEELFYSPPIAVPARLYAARVAANLTVLDPVPLIIGANALFEDPAIASNGTDWLVLWQNGSTDIDARRIHPDGSLGDTTTIATQAYLPAVVFDGSRYVIAWKELDEHSTLRMATLTSDGALVRSGVATIAPSDTRPYGVALVATPNGIGTAYARVSPIPMHGGVERTFFRIMKGSSRRRAAN